MYVSFIVLAAVLFVTTYPVICYKNCDLWQSIFFSIRLKYMILVKTFHMSLLLCLVPSSFCILLLLCHTSKWKWEIYLCRQIKYICEAKIKIKIPHCRARSEIKANKHRKSKYRYPNTYLCMSTLCPWLVQTNKWQG